MDPAQELKRIRKAISNNASGEPPIMHYCCQVMDGKPVVLGGHFDLVEAVRQAYRLIIVSVGGDMNNLKKIEGKTIWSGDALYVISYGINTLLFTPDQMGEAIEAWQAETDRLDVLMKDKLGGGRN